MSPSGKANIKLVIGVEAAWAELAAVQELQTAGHQIEVLSTAGMDILFSPVAHHWRVEWWAEPTSIASALRWARLNRKLREVK